MKLRWLHPLVPAVAAFSLMLPMPSPVASQAIPAPGQVADPVFTEEPGGATPRAGESALGTGIAPAVPATDANTGQTSAAPSAARPASPPPGAAATTALVAVDRPAAGASTPQRFTLIGWAVDPDGPGSGVDAVHLYLDGEAGVGHFLGAATYGEERLDVAEQLGQPRFALSGFSVQVEVPPGTHIVYVYARRRASAGAPWSAPATVEVTATPDGAVPATSRVVNLPPGACPRAPDGTCVNRLSMPAPTCPQIGPEGQCLPGGPGSLPGMVGLPAGSTTSSAPTGFCTQHDAGNRCLTYSNAPTNASALTLRVETSGAMATLSWTVVSGAMTYELLRCASAAGQSCTGVTVLSATSHQLPRTAQSWYRVEARTATGQVVATSNVVGPT
jgi:hypothetical protein